MHHEVSITSWMAASTSNVGNTGGQELRQHHDAEGRRFRVGSDGHQCRPERRGRGASPRQRRLDGRWVPGAAPGADAEPDQNRGAHDVQGH